MAVTIPVMAKARIGHFAEVQVLRTPGGTGRPQGAVGPGPGAGEPTSGRGWTTHFQLNNRARNVWVGPRG